MVEAGDENSEPVLRKPAGWQNAWSNKDGIIIEYDNCFYIRGHIRLWGDYVKGNLCLGVRKAFPGNDGSCILLSRVGSVKRHELCSRNSELTLGSERQNGTS